MAFSKAFWFYILVVIHETVLYQDVNVNVKAKVKSWGNKPLYPSEKIPENALSTNRSEVRKKIVLYHNFFRTKVRPTASNMLLMSWNEDAARQAQRYAEQCKFLVHNPGEENTVPVFGQCGQNIFVASQKTPWFYAIKTWFMEYRMFTYGSPNYILHDVGHYTQMVWAMSHKVGCGMAHCQGGPWGSFYNYVCHYCPTGNKLPSIHFPYKPGKPCADCPNDCVSNSLCTNSCRERDFFNNCAELVQVSSVCGLGNCNATCFCDHKTIYKNYPWT